LFVVKFYINIALLRLIASIPDQIAKTIKLALQKIAKIILKKEN